jgi:Neutral/alkaline non-lysosomal ceramidase, N-terminal
MKKWKRNVLIIFSVIFMLIAAILYYSISFIDTTPYYETQYYSNTIENLNNSLSIRKMVDGNLKSGFGRINITPKIVDGVQNPSEGEFNQIRLAGYGDGQNAKGVHDSVYVKAIAIDIDDNLIILISADLLMMPYKLVQKVEEKLKNYSSISREQLFFGATHTHASVGNCIPGYVGEEFEGEYQPEVVEWLSNKITEVILKSVSDLKPSKIASDFIHAPDLVANRINRKTGRLNDKLTIAAIRQLNGRNAAIGIFAAHATTLGAWNDQISCDYPGYFQRSLENKGVDMAMFFAGTVGSHTNKGKGSKFDRSKYVGEALADSANIILSRMKYSENVDFSTISTEIEVPKLQVIYITDGLRLSSEIGKELMPEIKSTYLQAVLMNNLLWITMPCELSGEYAIDLHNALELEGFNSAITSFNGQYLGYIVPAKYYYSDYYESRLMGWYGPSMGDYLMELNYTIADSLTGLKL